MSENPETRSLGKALSRLPIRATTLLLLRSNENYWQTNH